MTEHTYHVLGFYKLLTFLSHYASSPLGQSNCLSLRPSSDLKFIDNEQKLVSQMKLLLQVKGFFSFEGLCDIGPYLNNARVEGSYLEPDELLSIYRTIETSKHSKKFISENRSLCPDLYHLTKDTSICENLRIAIKKAIAPNGHVRDSASTELKKIRRKKAELRRELQHKLENIKKSISSTLKGDDPLISIREGRYVIPIRTDMKNRVDGIIHDFSHSQATCFFEPLEVVQDNNRLAEFIHLEKEEELKVLRHLTTMVKDSAENLLEAQNVLGELDGLYARAQLSKALNGIRPIMNQDGVVHLKQAQNPILLLISPEGNPPVPVDIFLDKEVNVLLISGPNRGGKTVTLKTLGLLSLMAQAGLHIPAAEGSCLPVFKKIMAEIGDDQDIQAGLSTFSAHMNHLKDMMDHADHESLIIIDEPGMGTDPDEGAALAMAILDDLSKKDALVAVSTHHSRLKTYGLLNERAKNASMEFDSVNNRPTFYLRYGMPGTSYASEIARDIGINKEILKRAREYLDQDEIRLNRLINKLNHLTQETAHKKLEAERSKKKYHSAREKVLKTLKKIESDKKALIQEKRAEADHLIEEARAEFKILINTFKNKKDHFQASVKQRYDEISKNLRDNLDTEQEKGESIRLRDFKIGQWVRHKRHNQEGSIITLDQYHFKATIMAGKIKFSADLKDLEILSDRFELGQDENSSKFLYHISESLRQEINLIGYRVNDALPVINKMIDRAMVKGDMSLKIIHGYGTGRLKEAIREHLKGFSCVKRICSADPQSGGEAVTMVELK